MTDITPLAPVVAPVRVGNIGSSIFRPFPSSQPFTYRESVTFQGMLERIRAWIEDDLIPYLNTDLPTLEDAWREQVGRILEAVDAALEQEEAAVQQALTEQSGANALALQAAINTIINSTIEVSDPVILGVLQEVDSQTRQFLDGLYPSHDYNDQRYGRFDVTHAVNAITGWVHVDQFGAKGDGTDDRAVIQDALDYARDIYAQTGREMKVYAPRVYTLNAVDYKRVDNTVFGAVCLMLHSGTHLFGPGTLKVKTTAYGPDAYFRVIGSDSNGIKNASVRDLVFDGNTANMPQSAQCGNISLTVDSDVDVINTRHLNANGVAIAVGGSDGGHLAKSVRILQNTVLGANDIGIQVSRFRGLDIGDNTVRGAKGNAIDVYGENGDGTSIGTDFDIHDNYIADCGLVGIFPETVARGRVHDNIINSAALVGIQVNRINGLPYDIDVHHNTIMYAPRGIAVVGDMQSITIFDNHILGASIASIMLGWGGNVSGVFVDRNTCNGADGSVPRVLVSGTQASALRVRGTISRYSDGYTDVLDTAQASVGNIYESVQPAAARHADSIPAGGQLRITISPNTAGKITVYAESGGGSQSVWQGVYTVNDNKLVLGGALTANNAPATLFASVNTDGGRTAIFGFTDTGSAVATRYIVERI